MDLVAERELLVRLGAAMAMAGESIDEIDQRLADLSAQRGITDVRFLVLPTALIVQTGVGDGTSVELQAFPNQRIRLDQVFRLYQTIDEAADPATTARDLIDRVDAIVDAPPALSAPIRVLGLGVLSVGFALTLQPTPVAVLLAFLLGVAVGALGLLRVGAMTPVFPVLAAFAVGMVVFSLPSVIEQGSAVRTLIPPLVTLLPGALLTTGMRDLAAGQVVSGSSRLVQGVVALALLASGIVAAATLVGVPESELLDGPVSRLGPWAPWLALVFVTAGVHLHHCAPRRTLPWILVVLTVAYGAQAGAAVAISPELASLVAALVMTPVVLWLERLPTGPPAIVTFLPAFWLLVPGAAGLIGVTELVGADSDLGLADFLEALGTVIEIALGVLLGSALFRAGQRGVASAQQAVGTTAEWLERSRRW
jgi:uncharacterized membrane protein YjjP (DUF1212 family)